MMTKITVEIDEEMLRRLVIKHLDETFANTIQPADIHIEVRSKQNFKSEWEEAAFRARVSKVIS